MTKFASQRFARPRRRLVLTAATAFALACGSLVPLAVSAAPAAATTVPTNPPLGSDANRYRYGLNITWTSTGPGEPNPIANSDGTITIGVNPYGDSFNVPRLVNEISSMGFDYVQVTDFHGAGTTLHPSTALDTARGSGYAASTDVLGALIDGLAVKGIATFLFTHPLDGHDYSEAQQTQLGFNDPTNGYMKWNDFINNFYAELVDTYGARIAGIGFDSELGLSGDPRWAGKLNLPRLRGTILSRQPKLWLGALAYPSYSGGRALVDYGIKEGFRPNWLDSSLSPSNYNTDQWPSFRSAPNIVSQNHWATLADRFSNSFANSSALSSFATSGTWSIQNGELYGSGSGSASPSFSAQTKSETGWSDTFTDASYQYDFRIASDSGDPTNWAGLSVRKTAATDSATASGYLVIFRNNGQIVISKPGTVLGSTNTGLSFTNMTHVRVESAGTRLSVYVGSENTPRLVVSDGTYASGSPGLATNGSQSFFDSFTADRRWLDVFLDASAWTAGSGNWATSAGEYIGNEGRTMITGKTWSDATFNVDFRITDNKGNSSNWAGVQIRKSAQSDQFFNSGYLVYVRSNGQVCLYKAGVGDLSCAASGLNVSATTHLKVVAAGPQIRVYIGGSSSPLIEASDTTFASGYVGLTTSGSVAAFNTVSLNATPISASRLTSTQVFRYTVLQAGAATQGPGIGWSYSPYSDGEWEVGAKETLTSVKALMDPVRASIVGTMPSNSYPLADGQRINALPNGIVATRKVDDSKEYIHVLNPPIGSTLQLPAPADGKLFSAASLLANGVAVTLAQNASGVTLTLPGGQTWNSVDTTLELTTSSVGSGQYGGTSYLLTNRQRPYVLRGTGDAYGGSTSGYTVVGVPSTSAGVEDRWTLTYLGNDRYMIVNQFRNQMLRMTQDDYAGNSALSSVEMVANGTPTTSDEWVIQQYATGGLRVVSVGFGRPLHSTANAYMGSATVLSICGVPISFNSDEDLWTLSH